MKVTASLSSLPPLMELIGGFGMVAALWYGSQQITSGALTTGEFTSFIAALFLMYGPAKKLSRVNANVQQAIAASERIFEMLDVHTEVHEKPNAPPLAPFRRVIEFRDVSFGYGEGLGRILGGVSFRVQAGQMIAIVGRSGAGKTTLVNLLPRFYDVGARRHRIRRRRHSQCHARLAQATDRHRDPGNGPVRRQRGEQHRLRQSDGAA